MIYKINLSPKGRTLEPMTLTGDLGWPSVRFEKGEGKVGIHGPLPTLPPHPTSNTADCPSPLSTLHLPHYQHCPSPKTILPHPKTNTAPPHYQYCPSPKPILPHPARYIQVLGMNMSNCNAFFTTVWRCWIWNELRIKVIIDLFCYFHKEHL